MRREPCGSETLNVIPKLPKDDRDMLPANIAEVTQRIKPYDLSVFILYPMHVDLEKLETELCHPDLIKSGKVWKTFAKIDNAFHNINGARDQVTVAYHPDQWYTTSKAWEAVALNPAQIHDYLLHEFFGRKHNIYSSVQRKGEVLINDFRKEFSSLEGTIDIAFETAEDMAAKAAALLGQRYKERMLEEKPMKRMMLQAIPA
jgi:hypothetical protein